ncbi:Putative Zn-dependent protease [hydrothermal vent metagenome]|uniref:Zn-dependent protease n=1 Tax=hydrothermal vent metagenome TaxID=652676 RepID=A0A3B0UI65_9ZZZZ
MMSLFSAFTKNAPTLARFIGATGFILLLSACTTFLSGPDISTSQTGTVKVNAIPVGTNPEDAVIGRREHPNIVATYGGVYSHRRGEIMLARIVSRLLVAAGQPETAFTITILDSPQINAFALPGGFIYVTRGILALANDSSELAAVLAHEIAHVTLRHARARTNRARTSKLVDQVISGVLGGDAQTDQSAARSRLSLAAFSQAQELAADAEGVRFAGRAGFDPRAAARFLGAMSRFSSFDSQTSENNNDFLSTHPSTPNRIDKVIETARGFGAPGMGEIGRASYLAAIDGIVFGDSPDQGVISGRQFIHPKLKFTFSVPERYSLQNSQSAVVGVAGDGEAMRFDSAQVPDTMDLGEYLKSGWIAGLDPQSVRLERYNGVEMASGTAKTEKWAFRVTALRFDGEVYRFIFAARTDSAEFQKAALQTIASFRRARASDLSKIRQVRIALVRARPSDTTETLASRMGKIPNAREIFYLINNLYAGDELVVGQQYKIVSVR